MPNDLLGRGSKIIKNTDISEEAARVSQDSEALERWCELPVWSHLDAGAGPTRVTFQEFNIYENSNKHVVNKSAQVGIAESHSLAEHLNIMGTG